VHRPDRGEVLLDGTPVEWSAPREALDAGIATVYQDLAMIPLMAVWRNFFLGREVTKGWGPLRRFDSAQARRVTRQALGDMGIDIRDPDQPVGTLSGGERQSVAIARAVHFGARVLILDEPTSALGVRQAGVVLRYIAQARDRGVGVVFITHNPHHAFPVGDRFLLLGRGRSLGDFAKGEISREEITRLMAGGAELDQLTHELERP
jgi:simple sugar transport system ATP-binding protein